MHGERLPVIHSTYPPLQPLTGETLRFSATANREDKTHVDVCSAGFWGRKYIPKAFFDVKVFNAMRLHTVHVACRYHHFIDGLNGRSKGSMNNVLE